MAGPLTSLKKSKKIPFPPSGGSPRNVPYRNGNYTQDESRLLEEISSQMASVKLKEDKKSHISNSTQIGHQKKRNTETESAPSDSELVGLLSSRLAQLEQKLQFQSKDISLKDKKIKKLEDKLRILQQSPKDVEHVQSLEHKCMLLQKQVHEMESFLEDYGLIWVGNSDNADDSSGYTEDHHSTGLQEWKQEMSVPESFIVDYDLIINNIKELNELAGDGTSSIKYTADGARLQEKKSVPLALYKNGILMFSGPFRSYSEPSTQQCMQDLMDGYFPTELQARYPDGVPLKICDRRHQEYDDRLSRIFQGTGQTLSGDQPQQPRQTINNPTVSSANEKPKESVEQLVNRMPKYVIKQGKVIDIQQGLIDTIQGREAPSVVTVLQSSDVGSAEPGIATKKKDHDVITSQCSTLRIKSEDGNHTYILKMKSTDTISSIRNALDKERGTRRYKIMSTYPTRCLDKDEETLEECGLVPNGTLYLHAYKR